VLIFWRRSIVKSITETTVLWKQHCVNAVSTDPIEISLSSLPEFWEHYDALPADIQDQADRQYALFEVNAYHPTLR